MYNPPSHFLDYPEEGSRSSNSYKQRRTPVETRSDAGSGIP